MNQLLWIALSLSVTIFSASQALAQKIIVSEVNKKMSQGENPGLFVFIPRVDAGTAEKDWKRQLKDWDAKAENSKGEVFGDNVFVSAVSSNTVDTYAELKDKEGGCEMVVWFDLGGAYLSKASYPEQWDNARYIIGDFAYALAKAKLDEMVKEEEKKLSALQTDSERLVKDKENLEKEIQRLTESMEKAKQDLAGNATNQEQKTKEITEQQKVVDAAARNWEKLEK